MTSISNALPRSAARLTSLRKVTPTLLGAAFLFYGLVCTLLLPFTIPPWQNPDEAAHFMRAAQIAQGTLIGMRLSGLSGGAIDAGISASYRPFMAMPLHPDIKVTPDMIGESRLPAWGGGTRLESFPNTAIYPPFLYLPSVAAIGIGKLSGLTIVQTLDLARVMTGLVATVLAAAAIGMAGSAALWIFTVLALPMAISQMAACTQDGVMFALTALFAAIVSTALADGQKATPRSFIIAAISISLVAMARPPYLALAPLLLLVGGVSRRFRVISVVLAAAATLGWTALAFARTAVSLRPDLNVDTLTQFKFVFAHPLALPLAAVKTMFFHGLFAESFIGKLGFLDVRLSFVYLAMACVALLAACLASRDLPGGAPSAMVRWSVVAAFSAAVAGVLAVQYLTFSEIGASDIAGVQGRYFIPPALVLAIILPRRIVPARANVLAWVLASFPLISILETFRAVAVRYYFG